MKTKSVILAIMYSLVMFFLPLMLIILSLKIGFDLMWLLLLMLSGSVLVWLTFANVLKKRKAICVKLMAFLVVFVSPIMSFILTFEFSNSILVLFKVEEIFSIAEAMLACVLDIFLWPQIIISQILIVILCRKGKKAKIRGLC